MYGIVLYLGIVFHLELPVPWGLPETVLVSGTGEGLYPVQMRFPLCCLKLEYRCHVVGTQSPSLGSFQVPKF